MTTIASPSENELSYFEQRMQLLGVTPELNQVKVWQYDAAKKTNVLVSKPIFETRMLDGFESGIKIFVVTLDRLRIPFARENSRHKKEDYHITRLVKPRVKPNGDTMKYDIPKGQGTYPFFHPRLIEKFEKKEHIENLYFTEGYFKAWKGCNDGLDVIGTSSITHMREKETGAMYADVVKLMKVCSVKRCIWLTDGDCRNITGKEITDGMDLYKRPKGFFQSANTFQQLLSDFETVEKWFAHILSDEIDGQPKGLDDLLCALPGKEADVVADLNSFSKEDYRFSKKIDISFSTGKLARYFFLDNVNIFYLHHLEKRQDIKGKEFRWNGTLYKWDEDKSECKIMVPGEAKNYFRVGDQYHEFVRVPNKYGEKEQRFYGRQKSTIVDDYGKTLVQHIPKYKAFCNVPDHINFQRVIYNCFNIYNPFEHEPAEEDCTEEDFPSMMKFLTHIFGSGTVEYINKEKKKVEIREIDLGLDYLQLLYQAPWQILPILCLVSKENETGKSTFAKLVKMIWTGNVAVVGNAELADNFNASWASKLLIICDEAKIDKQTVVEKVKSLSTADKVFMNAKGKDHVEIDFFGKFMFITNNEENFIYASEDDKRYWVRKVPVIKQLNNNLLTDMKEEIPALLSYLGKRKMATENVTRMWFDPALLKTEALRRVIAYSQPTIEKDLRQFIRDKFLDFGMEELLMTRSALHKDCFNGKYEANYLENVLKDRLKVDLFHEYEFEGQSFTSLESAQSYSMEKHGSADNATLQAIKQYKQKRYNYPYWQEQKMGDGGIERKRMELKDNGRPYVFRREKFLTADEIASIKHDPENAYQTRIEKESPVRQGGGQDDLPF